MNRKIKSAPARVKTVEEKPGTFEALVSVFGNVDHVGDVVAKGAFAKSLAKWADGGDRIPVIWSHKWDDPMAHIGVVDHAEETDDGLLVKATLDVDDNPVARQVARLLKDRRVTEFSFAYDVVDASQAELDGKSVYELRELDVFEVGPTLKGANPATQLVDAKALKDEVDALAKAGRVLSERNADRLRDAVATIQQVLATAGNGSDEDVSEDGSSAESDAEKSASQVDGARPVRDLRAQINARL